MSNVDDPFAALAETGSPEKPAEGKKEKVAKAEPKKTESFDAAKYFAAEMTINEEDYVLPEAVASDVYVKPKEHSYVPVRIVSAVVEERNQREIVVGYSADGTERTLDPKRIEELVAQGGSQQIEENVPYYQFTMEAEHVSGLYGSRYFPYRIFASVFDQMIPLKEKNRTKEKIGWVKSPGRKLLTATRAGIGLTLKNDFPLHLDAIQEAADAMVGKIVMAKVQYSKPVKSTDFKPRVNEDGSFVKAKVDPALGEIVKLKRTEEGSYVNVNSGEVYIGPIAGLIEHEESFLIPDASDDGAVVQDKNERTRIYDNLWENVFPVPHVVAPADKVTPEMANMTVIDRADGKKIIQRLVVVHRNDGSKAAAEVTWETVGQIAMQKRDVGTAIQAATPDGDVLTATWLGTHWQETPQPHQITLGELGDVRLTPTGPAAQDSSGLDEFKG